MIFKLVTKTFHSHHEDQQNIGGQHTAFLYKSYFIRFLENSKEHLMAKTAPLKHKAENKQILTENVARKKNHIILATKFGLD